MNKMAKGALATGVGVALLLGGGGTLATWNASADATAGSIVAGELNLVSTTGTWTNAAGVQIDLQNYKIVPGETIKYSQPLEIKLDGPELKATLTPDLNGSTDSFRGMATYDYSIKSAAGRELKGQILTQKDAGAATVTATVTLSKDAKNDMQKVAQDVSKIRYNLQQVIR